MLRTLHCLRHARRPRTSLDQEQIAELALDGSIPLCPFTRGRGLRVYISIVLTYFVLTR